MTIFEEPSIERMTESDEGQLLDFKSARIHPRDLADVLIAFANADGGLVVIGIEKDRQITGTRRHADNVQDLLRAAFDQCEPAVKWGRITNREYRDLCSVSDFTARADLNDLIERGLVISEGRGRSSRYRLAGD